MTLLNSLIAAGVNVRPNPGWETRTVPRGQTERTETLGICNHWDAIKGVREDAYYISGNRFGGLIYNIVINRDGLVRLLGQRLTWNAGSGDPAILQALRDNRTPQPPQDRWLEGRPLTPVVSGNPWLFGVCINYHPDEGAIPGPQREALVGVNRVLVDHFGLSVNQIIDHRGWTRRKSDISTLNLAQFRHDVATLEEDTMRVREFVEGLAVDPTRIDRLIAAGVIGGDPDFWKGLLSQPDHQAWKNFVNAFEVQTAINAAQAAKTAPGSFAVSLTGSATPR